MMQKMFVNTFHYLFFRRAMMMILRWGAFPEKSRAPLFLVLHAFIIFDADEFIYLSKEMRAMTAYYAFIMHSHTYFRHFRFSRHISAFCQPVTPTPLFLWVIN